jgi:hypothetical protein
VSTALPNLFFRINVVYELNILMLLAWDAYWHQQALLLDSGLFHTVELRGEDLTAFFSLNGRFFHAEAIPLISGLVRRQDHTRHQQRPSQLLLSS